VASHDRAGKFRNAGGDVMRSPVFWAATFLIVATAAFSQKPGVSASSNEVSQKDEHQIRQLESEMLKGEMNSDEAIVEKIYADDCVILPGRPGWTKARLVEAIHDSQGRTPPYIASEEDMHVYVLGDTAIAMYVKKYAVRANPDQVDRWDQTDVFVRTADTWKLKISRSSPLRRTEKLSVSLFDLADLVPATQQGSYPRFGCPRTFGALPYSSSAEAAYTFTG
jgi:ketosteroid isomerase-like protein